jgi:hypothetical protein
MSVESRGSNKTTANTVAYAFAVKAITGEYYCGYNYKGFAEWSDNIRRAKLYTTEKNALKVVNSSRKFGKSMTQLVKVKICEVAK